MNEEPRRHDVAPAPSPAPAKKPVSEAATTIDDSRPAALFHDEEANGFRSRWEAIQTGFVDEPRAAVEQADALVAQVVARLSDVFGDERSKLERHWDRGDGVSTEDLRIVLKRYRSFFDRLLSM
jgi:hypothetical protein